MGASDFKNPLAAPGIAQSFKLGVSQCVVRVRFSSRKPIMAKIDKICFDRILPNEIYRPHPGQILRLQNGPARAAFEIANLWPNQTTLRIRFLNGTSQQELFFNYDWQISENSLKYQLAFSPTS